MILMGAVGLGESTTSRIGHEPPKQEDDTTDRTKDTTGKSETPPGEKSASCNNEDPEVKMYLDDLKSAVQRNGKSLTKAEQASVEDFIAVVGDLSCGLNPGDRQRAHEQLDTVKDLLKGINELPTDPSLGNSSTPVVVSSGPSTTGSGASVDFKVSSPQGVVSVSGDSGGPVTVAAAAAPKPTAQSEEIIPPEPSAHLYGLTTPAPPPLWQKGESMVGALDASIMTAGQARQVEEWTLRTLPTSIPEASTSTSPPPPPAVAEAASPTPGQTESPQTPPAPSLEVVTAEEARNPTRVSTSGIPTWTITKSPAKPSPPPPAVAAAPSPSGNSLGAKLALDPTMPAPEASTSTFPSSSPPAPAAASPPTPVPSTQPSQATPKPSTSAPSTPASPDAVNAGKATNPKQVLASPVDDPAITSSPPPAVTTTGPQSRQAETPTLARAVPQIPEMPSQPENQEEKPNTFSNVSPAQPMGFNPPAPLVISQRPDPVLPEAFRAWTLPHNIPPFPKTAQNLSDEKLALAPASIYPVPTAPQKSLSNQSAPLANLSPSSSPKPSPNLNPAAAVPAQAAPVAKETAPTVVVISQVAPGQTALLEKTLEKPETEKSLAEKNNLKSEGETSPSAGVVLTQNAQPAASSPAPQNISSSEAKPLSAKTSASRILPGLSGALRKLKEVLHAKKMRAGSAANQMVLNQQEKAKSEKDPWAVERSPASWEANGGD